MKVIMLKTIAGSDFSFIKDKKYKALDGDRTGFKELSGKIFVKHPNSPKERAWWCEFDKACIGIIFNIYGGGW